MVFRDAIFILNLPQARVANALGISIDTLRNLLRRGSEPPRWRHILLELLETRRKELERLRIELLREVA